MIGGDDDGAALGDYTRLGVPNIYDRLDQKKAIHRRLRIEKLPFQVVKVQTDKRLTDPGLFYTHLLDRAA